MKARLFCDVASEKLKKQLKEIKKHTDKCKKCKVRFSEGGVVNSDF